jgi:hypothetical protein
LDSNDHHRPRRPDRFSARHRLQARADGVW